MVEQNKTNEQVESIVKEVLVMLSTETDAARVSKVNHQLSTYLKARAALKKVLETRKA